MRMARLELARREPHAPQTCAYTNSATSAGFFQLYHYRTKFRKYAREKFYERCSNQFSWRSLAILIKWRVLSVTKISCLERATAAIRASSCPVGLPINFKFRLNFAKLLSSISIKINNRYLEDKPLQSH
jgi:hypothetical protein